jgi:uncharacterized membrane protein
MATQKQSNIRSTIKSISIMALAVLIIDAIWIMFAALPLYQAYVTVTPNILGAVLAYICIITGIAMSKAPTLKETTIKATIIGFVMYGVYGFTNVALFKYPLLLAVTDALWGSILGAIGGFILFKFHK